MRAVIAVKDKTVTIDGIGRGVADLSWLDEDVHAVQWFGESGEVEYKTIDGKRKYNVAILSFEPYQRAVLEWTKVGDEMQKMIDASQTKLLSPSVDVNVIAD